jgi:hypothetical protein
MRKRFVPLVIALASLAAFGVFGVLTGPSTLSPQPAAAAPATTAESTAPAPAPTGNAPAPAAQAEEAAEDAGAPATVVTGCGKPALCPGRDCADCPHNTYLK